MSKEYDIATPDPFALLRALAHGNDKWGWQRGGISYIMWEKAYIEI